MFNKYEVCPCCGTTLKVTSKGYYCKECNRNFTASQITSILNGDAKMKEHCSLTIKDVINRINECNFTSAEKLVNNLLKTYPDNDEAKLYLLKIRYNVMKSGGHFQVFNDYYYRKFPLEEDSLYNELIYSNDQRVRQETNLLKANLENYFSQVDKYKYQYKVFLLTDDDELTSYCSSDSEVRSLFPYDLKRPNDAICMANSKKAKLLVIKIDDKDNKPDVLKIIKRFNVVNPNGQILLVKTKVFNSNNAIIEELRTSNTLMKEVRSYDDVLRVIKGLDISNNIFNYERTKSLEELKSSASEFAKVIDAPFDCTSYIDDFKRLTHLKKRIKDSIHALNQYGLSLVDIASEDMAEYGYNTKKLDKSYDKFRQRSISAMMARMVKTEKGIIDSLTSKPESIDFGYMTSQIDYQKQNYQIVEEVLYCSEQLLTSDLTYKSSRDFDKYIKESKKSYNGVARAKSSALEKIANLGSKVKSEIENAMFNNTLNAINQYDVKKLKEEIKDYLSKYDGLYPETRLGERTFILPYCSEKYLDNDILITRETIDIKTLQKYDEALNNEYNQRVRNMRKNNDDLVKKFKEQIKRVEKFERDYDTYLHQEHKYNDVCYTFICWSTSELERRYKNLEYAGTCVTILEDLVSKGRKLSFEMDRILNKGFTNCENLNKLYKEYSSLIKKYEDASNGRLYPNHEFYGKTYDIPYWDKDVLRDHVQKCKRRANSARKMHW